MDFITDARPAPADCQTMAEVRQGVDALDRLLVAVLAERQRYMDAAARIKPDRAPSRAAARRARPASPRPSPNRSGAR